MPGTLRVVNSAFLVLAIAGCRILGISDEPVKIRTTFVSYSATHTGESLPVWAGAKVSFTVTNLGSEPVELTYDELQQEIVGTWTNVSSIARGGWGGETIQVGQRLLVTRDYRTPPGGGWPGNTLAGRYRIHVFVANRRSNKVATGPMSYTETFVIVEQ